MVFDAKFRGGSGRLGIAGASSLLLLTLALALPTAVRAAQEWPIFKIGLDLSQRVPIHRKLFGVSYVWDAIPQGAAFNDFADIAVNRAHFALLRYPGGWDAEVYDWQNNTLTGSPGGRPVPTEPGATPWEALAAFPAVSFVMPSHAAIEDRSQAPVLAAEAANLVALYGRYVKIWEIGNEWWLQSGASGSQRIEARRLRAYARLLIAAVPAMKAVNPNIQIYATGFWQEPAEFREMRTLVGEGIWSLVDGVSVHVYCTRLLGPYSCRAIPKKLGAIAAETGKPLYVSEWGVTDFNDADPGDYGIWSANEMVSAIQAMVTSGTIAAAYWPAPGSKDLEPDRALFSADLSQLQATGSLLGWMRAYYRGEAVATAGVARAAAALDSRHLTLFVPTALLGHAIVRIAPPAGFGMRSAEVMVSADPTDRAGSQLVSIASAGWTVAANGSIDIEVNPGTAGRGSAAEILRATFAAPR